MIKRNMLRGIVERSFKGLLWAVVILSYSLIVSSQKAHSETCTITIAAGGSHTVGLKEDGTVVAVGWNGFGQLNVSSWTNIKAIAAGTYHTVGLKEDGTVVAMGHNRYSQSNVSSWTNIKALAAGEEHTVGLKEDGTVVAVGDNHAGQLNVSSWTNIKAIAAGLGHTVGLKEDGTVVAVGYKGYYNYDQLNVSSWTNIKAIAAGLLHTVGLKEDGTVVAVGYNYEGKLNVSSWTNIKAIASGAYHTVGLKEDGTVVAVGYNYYGELNVSSWTNIKAIAAGVYHTVGLKEDGTVVAVGRNYYGQLNVFDWSNIKQPVCLDVPSPDISSSTTLISFGAVEFGSSSAQSITISNIGAAELTIDSMSISGTDLNQFSQTNDCSSVAPNASCSITITFTPVSLREKSATLSIASNDTDTPTLTIPLTGAGVDTIPPTTSSMISGVPGNEGWYRSDVRITLTATDNYGGAGVKEIHYSIDGSETVVTGSAASFTVSAEGAHSVSYFARDNAGNSETPHTLSVKVDKMHPTITASSAPVPNGNGWHNTDVTVTFTCSDTLSGIASCPAPKTVAAEGAGQVITGEAVDKAGNKATASVTLNIDKTPPMITSLTTNPGVLWPPNHKMTAVTLGGSAADYGSDVASVVLSVTDEYGVYNMTGLSFGGTIQLEAWRNGTDRDGRQYTITAVVTDKAGNRSTRTTAVLVPHDMRP